MPKQNKRRMKRIKNLVIISGLTSILLVGSTLAWFIGMRTVNVSSFDVAIASTDSLLLSLDGDTWDTTVSISGETYNDDTTTDGDPAIVYTGNTNWWAGRGLLPMSTVGEMDATASRMKLFEKASLTTTPGGYRLLASRVNNYESGDLEQDGYVAFDLFVKNFSGTQYITALNQLDEEAIYLTVDSEVKVSLGGVPNTGIENSVRVGFAQIGRVIGTTTNVPTITGITCATGGAVTGICRTARIWEPNDIDHVAGAISWYSHSCKARTGANVTLDASYSGVCETIAQGSTYPTYAIGTPITSGDNVDVYDGLAYNKYTNTVKLTSDYQNFTDSMKYQEGVLRPTFMTLAPNSITKVRVYIYIEGQDVDNYDFASIGRMVSVAFGFTKERFTETDIDYTGPNLEASKDTTDPVITLLGDASMTIAKDAVYADEGATALDNSEGNITSKIIVTNTVNTAVIGTYTVTYNVTDWNNNRAIPVIRTVVVQ